MKQDSATDLEYMPSLEKPEGFSRQIQSMFGAVAPRYDFLNGLLSAGRDRYWRKKAVNLLAPKSGGRYLDVATGTADIAIEIARRNPAELTVMGIDFSGPMLELGKHKILAEHLESSISLQMGSGEHLPFADESFDGVTCAFGIRNFSDAEAGLNEMFRVLKNRGKVVLLEFSEPTNPMFNSIYSLYFNFFLPQVGRRISRHNSAYQYLPQSVSEFPMRTDFQRLMGNAGFTEMTLRDLTFGIVTLYSGCKNA